MGFDGFEQGRLSLTEWHGENSGRDTILVIDDDASVRAVLRMILNNVLPGLTVEEAISGEIAIKKLSGGLSARVAKIFTDNDMPGIKGLDLVRAVRGEESTIKFHMDTLADLRRVPVTLVSGDRLAEAKFLISLGILQAEVEKPFSPADIANSVGIAVKNARKHQR